MTIPTSPTHTRRSSRCRSMIAGGVVLSSALIACGGGDADSSDSGSGGFDTTAIFEASTSDEVCDVVPTSDIVEMFGGDNVTGSAQIGSVSCYLSGLGFPDIVIANDQTRDGLSDYDSVTAQIGPTQFDTTEPVEGIGDQAMLAANDNTQQLMIAVGGNTLTIKELSFDSPPDYLEVDRLVELARLLGVE